jgi:plastocyanin
MARRVPLVGAVACVLALAAAPPCLSGTVVKGRVLMPLMAASKSAAGVNARESLSPAEAVVYVTEVPGSTKLAGRGNKRDVELRGERFQPHALAVTVRSTVRFRNRDKIFHTLFSVAASGRAELGSIAPGKKSDVRFDEAGVFNIFCQLHPGAEGFVIVCPNWFHTRAAASGEYTLPPLPRGRYVVHAWHPRLGETRRTVEVTGRDVARIDLSL